MIYQKFSQRYLAATVLCLILTFGALGALILIYLFNESRSSLVLIADLTSGTETTAVETRLTVAQKQLQQKQHKLEQFMLQKHISVSNGSSITENIDEEAPIRFSHSDYFGDRSNHNIKDETNDDEDSDDDKDRKQQQLYVLQHQQQQRFINNIRLNLQSRFTILKDDSENLIRFGYNVDDGKNQNKISTSTPTSADKDDGALSYTKRNFDTDNVNGNDEDFSDDHVENDNIDDISQSASSGEKQKSNHHKYDLIYIDDFERPWVNTETSNLKIFDTISNEDSDRDSLKELNYKIKSSTETFSTFAFNKKDRMDSTLPIQQSKNLQQKLQFKQQQNKMVLKHQRRNQKPQQYFKRLQTTADNLDTLYDKNSSDIVAVDDDDEDHDDADALMTGSGSGDFDSNSIRNNVLYMTDNNFEDDTVGADKKTDFIKRISFKMLHLNRNNKNETPKSTQQQKNKIRGSKKKISSEKRKQHQQHVLATLNNNHRNDNKISKMFLQHFYIPASSEIVSNVSAPHLFQEEEKFMSTSIPAVAARIPNEVTATILSLNKNSDNDKQIFAAQPLAPNRKSLKTAAAAAAAAAAAGTWSENDDADVNGRIEINNSDNFIIKQNKQLHHPIMTSINVVVPSAAAVITAAELPIATDTTRSSSAAWFETRTRRIIGNVKKSEERSRQLLLCEEAGGGELCRMLFKGPLNE